MSAKNELDSDTMFDIMSRPKANQKETLKLDMDQLRDFFPDRTPKDMESMILQILTEWHRKERERSRERRDREER